MPWNLRIPWLLSIPLLDYVNGDSVEYTISRQGDLTKETYEDGDTVVYEYDNNGSLATVKDSATGITSTFHYDLIDRLARYQESGDGYTASWKYTYNTNNQLTRISEDIGNYPRNTYISYDQDHRIATWKKGFARVFYSYDPYGRIGSQTTRNDNTGVDLVEESFTYFSPGSGKTSGLVSRLHTTSSGGYDVAYSYTYDKNGNILSVSDGTNTTTYAYDSADQLLRENNQAAGTTTLWTYDDAGNILTRRQYAYTTAEDPGTATDTVNYTYGDTDWGDLLTGYDGRTITHDGIGNPLSDGIWTYTWEHGRELASMTDGTTTWDYTYNADGLRTRRTNGTSTYDYVYLDGQLMKLSVDGVDMYFAYDAEGTPLTVVYNDATHYYVTNVQGDVVGIVDYNGIPVVSYTYDAWGNLLTTTGTKANTIGKYNPLRYRGYVYDRETKLYYLQSRYYDPEMGRFVNADNQLLTGFDLTGLNLFAYCCNNPVVLKDDAGTFSAAATLPCIPAAVSPWSLLAVLAFVATVALIDNIADNVSNSQSALNSPSSTYNKGNSSTKSNSSQTGATGGGAVPPQPPNGPKKNKPISPKKVSDKYISQNKIDAHAFKNKAGEVPKSQLSKYDIYQDTANNNRLWVARKGGTDWRETIYIFVDLAERWVK